MPLGDRVERRRLIVGLLLLVAVALAGAALAPSLSLLAAASLAIGCTTVIAQVILPLAAQLAGPLRRGKVVGTILSGALLGILLARTVSGFVGAHFGWRTMFWAACGLALALAAVLARALPASPAVATLSYGRLLTSLGGFVRREARLREASLIGALMFAGFSAFWTAFVFLLESPAYGYDSRAVGLFGLIGAGGAAAAPLAGRLADRRGPRAVLSVTIGLTLASFVVFAALERRLSGLVAGVVLLDLGVQATMVSNQTRVYSLVPGAESRLNTVYMVAYFLGGSLGSTLGAAAWSAWRWPGVCAVGALFTAAAWLVHAAGTGGRLRARLAGPSESV